MIFDPSTTDTSLATHKCYEQLVDDAVTQYIEKYGLHMEKILEKCTNTNICQAIVYKVYLLKIIALPKRGSNNSDEKSDFDSNSNSDSYSSYDFDDSDDIQTINDKLTDLPKPVYFFGEIDSEKYYTDHGGVILYYKAYCPKCETEHIDRIWGD